MICEQKRRPGFTLVETLVTTVVMVIVFALLAVIFGRATTIHRVVRRGGDAENFGVYLLNTILYGPGIDREQGLVGAQSVYLPGIDTLFDSFQPSLGDDRDWGDITGALESEHHLYLAFQPQDPAGADPVVFRLALTDGEPLTMMRASGTGYDFQDPGDFIDLMPAWARDEQLEIRPGSHFAFCRRLDSSGCEPAVSSPDEIRYVLIHLEIKSAFQPEEETVVLRRFVRVRNVLPVP